MGIATVFVECETVGVIRLAIPLLVVLLILGCGGDDPEPSPDATPGARPAITLPPGSTAVPGTTPVPPATGLPAAKLKLTGMFLEPQESEVEPDVRELPPRPATEFRGWDGASVVVFDTQNGTQHNFGPGNIWLPPFGGQHFVYTSDNEVWLVDLNTMERESIAAGIVAYFLGDRHVVINPGDNRFYAQRVDYTTRTPIEELTSPLLRSMLERRWAGKFLGRWMDGRYAIHNLEKVEQVCDDDAKTYRVCLAERAENWMVKDLSTGEILLAFRANKVVPGARGEIIVATTPRCEEAGAPIECYALLERLDAENAASNAFVEGTTNLFSVSLTTGQAQYLATASYNAGAGAWPMAWPLAADADYVVWTESYCGNPRGMTKILYRATGEIVQLDQTHWVTLRDGKLGLGEYGAKVLLDPATLEYVAVLPELADVTWSADFRFAAVGQSSPQPSVCD